MLEAPRLLLERALLPLQPPDPPPNPPRLPIDEVLPTLRLPTRLPLPPKLPLPPRLESPDERLLIPAPLRLPTPPGRLVLPRFPPWRPMSRCAARWRLFNESPRAVPPNLFAVPRSP